VALSFLYLTPLYVYAYVCCVAYLDLLVRLGPRVVWVSSQMVSAILVWCLTLIPEGGKHTAVAVFALLGTSWLIKEQLCVCRCLDGILLWRKTC
jgi:hypothetical protein